MNRRLGILTAIATLAIPSAANADVIVQDRWNSGSTLSMSRGQSFTAIDSRLKWIEFYYTDENTHLGQADITVTVFAGEGFGGAQVASATRNLNGAVGYQRFTFADPALTPGAVYSFRISSSSGRGFSYAFQNNASDPGYLGGRLLSQTGQVVDLLDLRFRIQGNSPYRLTWQHGTHGSLAAWNMYETQFTSGAAVSPAVVPDVNWKIVGSGDFNDDGHADLFWQHQQTRLMTVWLMNGTNFVAPGLLSHNTVSDPNWAIRAIADMDRDGDPDLIWQHEADGWLTVWIMDGLTLVRGEPLTPNRVTDANWRIAATADFDNDGDTDLLWQHAQTGLMTTWLMDGTSFAQAGLISVNTVSDTNWKIKAAVDVDGNGSPDFLWHHQVTGALVVWFMDGTTYVSGQTLTPGAVPDVGWQIVAPR